MGPKADAGKAEGATLGLPASCWSEADRPADLVGRTRPSRRQTSWPKNA